MSGPGESARQSSEAIDTKSSKPRFTRYRHVLSSKSQIKEGIALALHPLIPMKRYPGPR